jgi:hypothetical protein
VTEKHWSVLSKEVKDCDLHGRRVSLVAIRFSNRNSKWVVKYITVAFEEEV